MKGVSRPKIRRSWGNIKPYTKVKESKKVYDRKKEPKGSEYNKDITKHEQTFLCG